ncbi:hypothetical protein SDC9_00507 [bioreactor metagenome]|uniref:Uncharacterized protein n=1 Tax=bioreactor metagenome TaxID=1076179 RepID=A0A644SK11_9ZZZZ
MKINLIINLKDKDSSLSFYQYYPRLFKAYFPKVNEIIIEELSDAGYLYFQSTLALDQLIDNKNIQKIFEITILQEESIKLLTDIFGYDSIFWNFWNNSRNDYIEAIKIDHRLRNSKDVAFEEYQELADKKSTFGKIAIYSLKILSNTEDANIIYQKILLSHYYFSIGLQLYDDVKDLKEDYTNNQFNWSIYLLKKEIGNNNFSFETLNKLFYIKGIAEKVLSTSLDNFRKSINILKEIGIESEWLTVNLDMYETINNYLHITKGYIKILYKKLEVKKTERPSQKFINYETINKSYISKGLEFIKKDFDSNYVNEEGDNSQYWGNQLQFYKKSINLAKEKVQEEIDYLLLKGVNVSEIEYQKKVTENKIVELDEKLDELPNVREELVSKYQEEKEMQLKINKNKDYMEERKVENSVLFSCSKLGLIEKKIKLMKIDDVNKKYYNKR